MRFLPGRPACFPQLAGGEPASLGSCVPLGANHHQTSSLPWALADGPHLCPSAWGEASLSSRWKQAGGMGGPRGLVTSILPSHTGCRWGRPCGWRSAEHSSTSPRARPGLPARWALLGSILWRSWIYAPAYPLTFCLAAREPPASHGLCFPICQVGLLTGWFKVRASSSPAGPPAPGSFAVSAVFALSWCLQGGGRALAFRWLVRGQGWASPAFQSRTSRLDLSPTGLRILYPQLYL